MTLEVSKLNTYALLGADPSTLKVAKSTTSVLIGAPLNTLSVGKIGVYAWLAPNPLPRRRITGVSATVGRIGVPG